MTKSQIFSNAWIAARTAALRFGGKASEYFVAALREVYAALSCPVGRLVALGGKEWKKPEIGQHRVYFDSVASFVGVTKNTMGYLQDGRKLSNNAFRETMPNRFHYDVLTRQFGFDGGKWAVGNFDRAVKEIRRLAGI